MADEAATITPTKPSEETDSNDSRPPLKSRAAINVFPTPTVTRGRGALLATEKTNAISFPDTNTIVVDFFTLSTTILVMDYATGSNSLILISLFVVFKKCTHRHRLLLLMYPFPTHFSTM